MVLPVLSLVSLSFIPRCPPSVVVLFLPHALRLGPRETEGGERERERASIMHGHGLSPPPPPSAAKRVGLAMRICRGGGGGLVLH